MMPATLSIISATFAARERGTAIGIWAGVSAMALAIGPLLGGVITEHISWNWIFYVNVPIGVLGIVAGHLRRARVARHVTRAAARPAGPAHLGDRPARARLRADRGEQLRLDVGPDPRALRDRGRRAQQLRLPRDAPAAADARPVALQNGTFAGANIIAILVTLAMFGIFVFFPIYMQTFRGWSPIQAGRGAAAVDVDDRDLRADRREAVRPRRLALAHRRRDDRCRYLLPAALDDQPALVVLGPAPRVHPRRPRDVVRNDPDVGRSDGRRARRQGGRRARAC